MAHQKNGLFLCNAKWHTITLQLDLAIERYIATNNQQFIGAKEGGGEDDGSLIFLDEIGENDIVILV
jgi:hypothetical protein